MYACLTMSKCDIVSNQYQWSPSSSRKYFQCLFFWISVWLSDFIHLQEWDRKQLYLNLRTPTKSECSSAALNHRVLIGMVHSLRCCCSKYKVFSLHITYVISSHVSLLSTCSLSSGRLLTWHQKTEGNHSVSNMIFRIFYESLALFCCKQCKVVKVLKTVLWESVSCGFNIMFYAQVKYISWVR